MRIIGIDPGLEGALALIDTEEKTALSLDLPTLGEGKDRELDGGWILRWIVNGCPDHVVLERVRAIPSIDGKARGMGAVSSFNFGMAFGQVKGILQCAGFPFTLVHPATWKNYYKLKRGKEEKISAFKERSRQLALRLYPNAAISLQRKGDHNRAEALLIAAYGFENGFGGRGSSIKGR